MERKTEQDVVMRTWKTEMVRTCREKDRARCSVVMRTWKTEMVRTCREKDRARCSDENMED